MSRNIMVDIETLGTKPGCAILSIGAVEFNPFAELEEKQVFGKTFYAEIDLMSCLMAGLTIDPNTLQFWRKKYEDETASFFGEQKIGLMMALAGLKQFVQGQSGSAPTQEIKIWANSPSFDCDILEFTLTLLKIDQFWSFRDRLDCRTAVFLSDLDLKTLAQPNVKHNALDDAKFQARSIQAAVAKLQGKNNGRVT